MIYPTKNRKPFPDKVTKHFIFAEYGNQYSTKELRKILNYYNNILGFNVRKRILDDIVVILFIEAVGFPQDYKISPKIEMQFKKLDFEEVKKGVFKRPNVKILI